MTGSNRSPYVLFERCVVRAPRNEDPLSPL